MDTIKVADKKICYLGELIKFCLHNVTMWKWACEKLWLYVTLEFNHNDGINCLNSDSIEIHWRAKRPDIT